MIKLRAIALFALLLGATAGADTLEMRGISADGDGTRPTRGMSENAVAARFGEPVAKKAAVGEPPISRWEYTDFIVYFEYDKVIHAVVKR